MNYDRVQVDCDMGVELINATSADDMIAKAARTSTKGLDNDGGRVAGLVKALWREGHVSPFEHSHLTFAMHVPLFVRDQVVRHRSMSFNIQSARYREFEPVFYLPSGDRPTGQSGKPLDYERQHLDGGTTRLLDEIFMSTSVQCWMRYQSLLERGVAPEVARMILPANIYTSIWVTGSLRSWLHFLDQRLDEHAQWEIRKVAEKVLKAVREVHPIAVEAWEAAR